MLDNSITRLRRDYISSRSLLALTPRHNAEVIAIVALVYTFDLSEAEDPLLEYNAIREDPYGYRPLDLRLRNRFDSPNLEVDGLYLSDRFNPQLPYSFYTTEMLSQLWGRTGQASIPEAGMADQLRELSTQPTFSHGDCLTRSNTETVIENTALSEVSSDNLVSYGCTCDSQHVFTYVELADTFTHYGAFLNPCDSSSVFSEAAIKKLRFLSDSHIRFYHSLKDGESNGYGSRRRRFTVEIDAAQRRSEICEHLRRTIDEIDLFQRQLGPSWQVVHQAYTTGSELVRSEIVSTLEAMRDMTMHMRGWSGSGAYPLQLAPVSDSLAVDIHTNKSILVFEAWCDRLDKRSDITEQVGGAVGKSILLLPLFEYKRGIFVKSQRSEQGLTIRGRLHLVKGSFDVGADSSCIRLSSNWFGATVYRYMRLLELDPGFDIRELRFIS